MTLGEHIQALRKEKGLSQEALGDALGVTRQSISKWESNGALPEVEKLIAMSKLFGVSVGVLLQVEEASADALPHELTERELAAVEAIVEKYLAQTAKALPPKRKKWPIFVGILLVIVFSTLFSKISELNSQLQTVQNNVLNTTQTVNSQLSGLTVQVKDILERQNTLLAGSSYSVEAIDLPGGTITYSLTAVPKQFVEGMTAQFSAQAEGGEPVTADAVLDPATRTFTAELTYPHASPITLSVAFRSGDTVQTQVLGKDWSASDLYPSIRWYGSWWGNQAGRGGLYHCTEYINLHVGDLTIKTKTGIETVQVESIDFLFYVDRELVKTLPMNLSVPHDDAAERSIYGTRTYFDLPLSPGCELLVVAEATDNFGRTWREIMDCYTLTEENNRLDYLDCDSSILDTLP